MVTISRYRRRNFAAKATIAAAISTGLAIIILSPLALKAVATIFNLNWIQLSNIGQAYGAISALIAGIALAGVAASVFLQAHETRHNRWAADRGRHFELMRMAVEDPFYQQAFSLPDISTDQARISGYINLLLQHWSILWEFGDISEPVLRGLLADVLHSNAGRTYWKQFGNGREQLATSEREIEFIRVADAVYGESTASSATLAVGSDSREERKLPSLKKTITTLAVGILIGVVSDRLTRPRARTQAPSWGSSCRD